MPVEFRPDTSFPFLAVARKHGVDYGEVLTFTDSPAFRRGEALLDWQHDVVWVTINERQRRERVVRDAK